MFTLHIDAKFLLEELIVSFKQVFEGVAFPWIDAYNTVYGTEI